MKNIVKFKLFEAEEVAQKPVEAKPTKERSGRLLTDEQENAKDGENAQANAESGAPSIMFTDVVGSSKLWSDDPQEMKIQLDKHFTLMNNIAKQHNGFVVKTIGDAFMIYFGKGEGSLKNAINCAKKILLSEKLPLRVGICQGNMEEKSYNIQNANLRDFFGNAVNTASRMESKVAGEGGSIAFTSLTGVSDELAKSVGAQKVENIPDLKGVTVKSAYKIKVK
jgi:class 3 adenylate cyclase